MRGPKEFCSKKLRLIHWNDHLNFGDCLSPYIISKLSGLCILSKKASISWINLFKCLLKYPGLIKYYVLPYQKNLLAVGSIMNLGNKKSIIWGSGFLDSRDSFFGGKIYATRGPLSEEKAENMGGNLCGIYGDPALLLPLIYQPNIKKKYKVGIVPHWRETNYFIKNFPNHHIIDVRTDDVETVIDQILCCEKILSSSLHGIITAHAFGIPALWINPNEIVSNGFKFEDYFLSVGIKPYKGFSNLENILNSEKNTECIFNLNTESALPQIPLKEIQHNLLVVAPFAIKNTIWVRLNEYR